MTGSRGSFSFGPPIVVRVSAKLWVADVGYVRVFGVKDSLVVTVLVPRCAAQ